MGEKPLTVRVAQERGGVTVFDVINLKKLTDAKSAAAWIFKLYQNSKGKNPHYSNSVHLEFTDQFDQDQIQLVCDTFEMGKVYIMTASIEKDGKKTRFEYEPDLENSLRLLGESEDELKKVRDAVAKMKAAKKKNKAAEQGGAGQPATRSESK